MENRKNVKNFNVFVFSTGYSLYFPIFYDFLSFFSIFYDTKSLIFIDPVEVFNDFVILSCSSSCFCIIIGFWSFWDFPRHQKEVHRSRFPPFGSVLGGIWGRLWEYLRDSWATKRPRCPQDSPRPPQKAPRPPQKAPRTPSNLQNGHPDIPKELQKSNPKDHQNRIWKIITIMKMPMPMAMAMAMPMIMIIR